MKQYQLWAMCRDKGWKMVDFYDDLDEVYSHIQTYFHTSEYVDWRVVKVEIIK